MSKIKTWIQNSNGWQRLWLVGVVAAYIYLGIFVPFQESSSYSQSKFSDMREIEAEMKKPECAPYLIAQFNQLPTELHIKSICSGLYYETKGLISNELFSLIAYETEMNSRIRFSFHDDIKFGMLYATFLSAIVYALGALAAWVIKGFRKKEL
jgi:hypothetical protein